jgi:putative addiction module component (TIGR02574 family)
MNAINLSEVMKLPVQERIRIVEAIWDSVAEHPEQIELMPWQTEELDRRFAAYQENPSEGIHWDEVKRRILCRAY